MERISNTNELNNLWKKVLEVTSEKVNERRVYDAFFKDTYIFSVDSNKMVISCPNSLSSTLISQKYSVMLSDIVTSISGTNYEMIFETEEALLDKNKTETKVEKTPFFPNNYLESLYTFDNFVIGPTNREAQSAALIVASNPGDFYNPLFIYSQSGLGKTHLLNAIGNYIREKLPLKKILFCSSQDFVDEYIKYVSGEKKEDDLKVFILGFDVFLVDDIQLLQNKTKTEEFFFAVFESFIRQGKQIVITCDRLPSELSGLSDRLVTRFLRGLTVEIQKPTTDLCLEILRKKIDNSTYNVKAFDDDVLYFIADSFKDSIRSLEGALNRLVFYCTINHLDHIDIDVTQDALSTLIDTKTNKNKISIQRILNVVATYYGINSSQITGKIKTKDIVFARQIAIYLIRTMLDTPYTKIGEVFGNRDHATIMYSYNKVEGMLKKDKEIPGVINKLKTKISSNKS